MYTPWLVAVGFAALMVVARLITNRSLMTTGQIPTWVSVLYMLGLVGMIAAAVWSILSVAWWGPIPILLVYLATNLVPSVATEAYSRAKVIGAAQQATEELSDMLPGPEKMQRVQERIGEILRVRKP